MIFRTLLCAAVFLATGCTAIDKDKIEIVHNALHSNGVDKRLFEHILNVGPEGGEALGRDILFDFGTYPKRNPITLDDGCIQRNLSIKETKSKIADLNKQYDESAKTSLQTDIVIQGINRYLKCSSHDAKRIVIFIHGGLVEEVSVVNRVAAVHDLIEKDVHPIFINWEAGLFDTYSYQLTDVRHGQKNCIASYDWPIPLVTDAISIPLRTPEAWQREAYQHLLLDEESFDATLDAAAEKHPFVSKAVHSSNPGSGDPINRLTKWLGFAQTVADVSTTGLVRLLTMPATHVIGKSAWDEMLRRANNVVYPSGGITRCPIALKKNNQQALGSPVATLMNHLYELQKNESVDFTVDLIGHSMGAIIANKLVRDQLDFKFNNIVHMASADRVDGLFSAVFPYMELHRETKFYSLHLHPINEIIERNFFGLAPEGSLLTYIDDMYTDPGSVFARRAGNWDSISRVIDSLPLDTDITNRLQFTVFGVDKDALKANKKKNCRIIHPQKHGDFSKTYFWKEEVWLGLESASDPEFDCKK